MAARASGCAADGGGGRACGWARRWASGGARAVRGCGRGIGVVVMVMVMVMRVFGCDVALRAFGAACALPCVALRCVRLCVCRVLC